LEDSQLENCIKVLDGLPAVQPNDYSPNGPIIVFDRGYGKKKMVDLVRSKNFKLITIAATVGSEHPIVPLSAVDAYHDRIMNNTNISSEILAASLSEFDASIQPWVISDDPNVLLGPELKICVHSSDSNLCAIAIRDIFDKKIPQKVLRFFTYGMKETTFLNANEWVGVLKIGKKDQFDSPFNNREFMDVDNVLQKSCVALTRYQRTADWFILRAFHATATMAGSFLSIRHGLNNIEAEPDSVLMTRFTSKWFSRTRSTEPMVIGSKNEEAVLRSLSQMPYVKHVFNVGLLESNRAHWLAASPDAIALVNFDEDDTPARPFVVEVKTRVSLDQISAAEQVLKKHADLVEYSNLIACEY